MQVKDIELKKLNIWDQNPRFPQSYCAKSDKELIKYFFAKSDEKKALIELAESIAKSFNLIPLEKIVVYQVDNKYIVLEGNRRLIVYKLLANPKLADDEKIIRIFIGLRKKYNIDINENHRIECLVTKNREVGLKYVEIKHLERGYKPWGEVERNRFKQIRGLVSSKTELLKNAFVDKVKQLKNVPEEIKDIILGPGFVTTFFRVVTSNPAKDYLAYELDTNGRLFSTDPFLNKKLKIIIWELLNKKDHLGNKLNSRTLNTKDKIKTYLDSIDVSILPTIETAMKQAIRKTPNLLGGVDTELNVGGTKKRVRPLKHARRTLIPRSVILIIHQHRINAIYRELREKLVVEEVPNAVAVLFRVFLELTLNYFAKIHGHEFKKDDTMGRRINVVINILKQKYNIPDAQLKYIQKVPAKNPLDFLSIENFHEYVHDVNIIPEPGDLKAKWDNLEGFFRLVYKILETKDNQQ